MSISMPFKELELEVDKATAGTTSSPAVTKILEVRKVPLCVWLFPFWK